MSIELDHVFILCDVDAPEAAALAALGFKEEPPNTHPGQGTACRRFLFSNAYLELLWVRDEREARSEGAHRTRLWERWSMRRHGACPFGIVFRPATGSPAARPPFPSWGQKPDRRLAVDFPFCFRWRVASSRWLPLALQLTMIGCAPAACRGRRMVG